ncbi:MAG: hypothetical protein RBJ76_13445 [Stenomitos frigidus ULC029]
MKKEHLLSASAGLLLCGGIGLLHASTFFAGVETQINQEKGTVVTIERKSDATFLIVLVGLLQVGLAVKVVLDLLAHEETLVPLNLPATVAVKDVPDFETIRPVAVAPLVAPQPMVIAQPIEAEEEDPEDEHEAIDLVAEYMDEALPARLMGQAGSLALIGLPGSGKTTLVMSLLDAVPEATVLINHWHDCAYGAYENILKLGQESLVALQEQVQAVQAYLVSRSAGADCATPVWLVCDDWSQTVALAEGLVANNADGAKDTWKTILATMQELVVRGQDFNVNLLLASRLPDLKLARSLFRLYVVGHTAERGTLAIQAALKNQHLMKNREAAGDLLTELGVIESLTDVSHLVLSLGDETLVLLPDLSQNWTRTPYFSSTVQLENPPNNLVQLHDKPTISQHWYDICQQALADGRSTSDVVKNILKMGGANYQEGKKFLDTLMATFQPQTGVN